MKQAILYFIFSFLFIIYIPSDTNAKPIEMERTESVHFNSVVADSHIDTMMEVISEETLMPAANLGEDTPFHFDIQKAKAGGINAPFLAAYTSGYLESNALSISKTLAMLHGIYWTAEENPEELEIASNSQAMKEIIAKNKIAAIPTIEGAYSMEEQNAIGLLHQYHDLGVRMIGFNWNYSNALGEGASRVYGDSAQTPSEGGLTELGAQVVKEMNRLGMLVDVSHMARETFWDVLEVSEAPIIASHSGVNAIKDHERNLTDEQLLALKENGGVISIVYYPAFLTDSETGYVDDIVDHIDYAVDLIGIDHVGLGSDYDGAPMPADLQDASDFPRIIEELAFRGYTKQEIEQIIGGNMIRLLEETEAYAEDSSSSENPEEIPGILPELEMGEAVATRTPHLAAKLDLRGNNAIEDMQYRVLVDGQSYETEFDKETQTLSLELTEALEEKFHVVTFEVTNEHGDVGTETRIFYVQE